MNGALPRIPGNLAPSPFGTLQDAGRQGWQRVGESARGAMNVEAPAAANALVTFTFR